MNDCKKTVNIPELHSDEFSTDDKDLVNKEQKKNQRPEWIASTNLVIKVYDKKWQSSRVCKVVKLF
jgi:hypothetical protein